ncbi:MAG: hypothetical protein BWY76_02450 [bacterium ADurb.Bin429]|nr:MAG: hypothetical protein BWY76_02450 [bacterium ADurb.Bin429]
MLDRQNPRDPFDLRFLNAMIAHHEEGLSMAKDAVERIEHPELRDMVEKMMYDQQKEVRQMRHHRQEWYEEKAA